jgi:hypothetical protein
MHTATTLQPLLATWPGIAALLALTALVKIIARVFFNDRFSEMRVLSSLRGLDPARYRHFHNLHLPHPTTPGTIRIEHVVVSQTGIFVIETTRRRGWISGTEHEPEWVQLFHRQRRHFQNPLKRNEVMVSALAQILTLPDSAFHPVHVFLRDCDLKPTVPGILLHDSLIPWIRRQKEILLDPHSVGRAISNLEAHQHPDSHGAVSKIQLHTLHIREAV